LFLAVLATGNNDENNFQKMVLAAEPSIVRGGGEPTLSVSELQCQQGIYSHHQSKIG
jgi:hypothetical protein